MRGRKPKPTVLKLVAGNPGGRKMSLNEPVPEAGPLERPAYLDPIATEMWNEIVPRLVKSRVAKPIDTHAIAMYCAIFSQWKQAMDWVTKHGAVRPVYKEVEVDGRKVQKVVDSKEWPQAKQLRQLGMLLCRLASELGITPASRPRVSTGEMGAGEDSTRDEEAMRKKFFSAG